MSLLGGNENEKMRKSNLKELEDKRIAFAEAHQDLKMDSALLVQFGGGLRGVGIGPNGIYLLTGPGPGEEGDFTLERYDHCVARLRDEKIASEGAAGILGFGKKGGLGFTLIIEVPEKTYEITFVSGYNFLLEVTPAKKNPLMDTKRRPGNANIVWDMRSIPYTDSQTTFAWWHKALNEFEIE